MLSGGEPAAVVVIDALTRLLPGAVGNESSTTNESFSEGFWIVRNTRGRRSFQG